VVTECFSHVRIAEIGPTGSQRCPVAAEGLVQAGGSQPSALSVANTAEPFIVFQGISHHTFVGCILIVFPLNTTVTVNAVLDIVD
jgi:hypothetical protein